MSQPKLLHVINNLNLSGATMLLLDVAVNVRPQPGRFTVCTLEPDNPMADAFRAAGAEVISPVETLNITGGAAYIRRVINNVRPDIVHTHLLPATQVGLAAAKLTRVPAVTTVHFTFDCLRTAGLLRRASRLSYRFYRSIIAISEAVKESLLAECHVRPDRVAVVHNGVDFDRAVGNTWQRRSATSDLIVGSIGRLVPAKGYDTLLEAMARIRENFKNTKLVLIGDGPDRGMLEAKARDLGIRTATLFGGACEKPSHFLAGLDIFVLPSRSEGLGISLIEAMAAGLPCVGSTAGGIPEVIEHGTTGLLFEKDNSADLAHRLEVLIRSPRTRKQIAAAGQRAARQRFSIQTHIQKLYDHYAAMLEQPKAAEAIA